MCQGQDVGLLGFFLNYFCPRHVSFPIHRKLEEHLDVNETLGREQKVLSCPFLNRKPGEIPTRVDAKSYTLSMGSCKGFL